MPGLIQLIVPTQVGTMLSPISPNLYNAHPQPERPEYRIQRFQSLIPLAMLAMHPRAHGFAQFERAVGQPLLDALDDFCAFDKPVLGDLRDLQYRIGVQQTITT